MTADRVSLGTYPTPVQRLDGVGGCELFVKRDDIASALYGGGKVRKLEFLLAAARERRRSRLLTFGAVGSHHVVATALFGAAHGFEVEVVLVPQPASGHARRNLELTLAHATRVMASPTWATGPALLATRWRRDAFWIPLGGSNVVGTLGFVGAARELVEQVRGGELPEPDLVVVALGSGGTAAGLAVGFEAAGVRTRVLAVPVSHPAGVLVAQARVLARRVAAHVGVSPRSAARRIEADPHWVGRGYGYLTPSGQAALVRGRELGVVLDPSYTAKSFACALARARAGRERTIVFWQTLGHEVAGPAVVPEVPRAFERLLR